MPRFLHPLPVVPQHPTSILPDLEAAIAGGATFAPLPGGRSNTDRARADLLTATFKVGSAIDPDVALVVATSGSTGRPKGSLLTPHNLVSSADATHQALGGEGAWLLAMPGHHIAGLQVMVRSIVAGYQPEAIDVSGGFSIPAFAAAATALRRRIPSQVPCYTALVPLQLAKALDTLVGIDALRLFNAVLIGGGPMDPQLRHAAQELGVNIVHTYGSSETSGGLVYDGLPLPGARVKVTSGRILLAGPMVAKGYRNADSSCFQDGWYTTSDAGRIVNGKLLVVGRVDTVISTGGLKLQPEEIERAMSQISGVDAACVVGLPHPRLGTEVCAAYTGTASITTILSALSDRPRWQLPRHMLRLESMPLTGPGKIDRQEVATLVDADRTRRRQDRR